MRDKTPVFKVDFRNSPENRWDELLTDTWAKNKARTLCRACYSSIERVLGQATLPLTKTLSFAAHHIARSFCGEFDYHDDMNAWSHWAVGDLNEVILANFSYELHQTGSGLIEGVSGAIETAGDILESGKDWLGLCTSVGFRHPSLGMVHCRNVDWPIAQMKAATIILDCKSEAGPFRAVSVPGMVGVLSGVAKGRFSITLNSKEDRNHVIPNLRGWGGSLLLRWIFESCGSYAEAVRELKKASAFVPFYAMVVGPKSGQACVIEVNKSGRNRVYKQSDYPVAVANHYPGEIWDDSYSQERQEIVEASAAKCRVKTLRGCFAVVNPVVNADTVQSMVFHPKSGRVLVQEC